MTDGLPDPLPSDIINGAIGSFTVSDALSHEFLGPSPKRVGLLIAISAGSNSTINNKPIASTSDGFQWTSGQSALYFDSPHFGEMLAKPWFIMTGAPPATVSWIELLKS